MKKNRSVYSVYFFLIFFSFTDWYSSWYFQACVPPAVAEIAQTGEYYQDSISFPQGAEPQNHNRKIRRADVEGQGVSHRSDNLLSEQENGREFLDETVASWPLRHTDRTCEAMDWSDLPSRREAVQTLCQSSFRSWWETIFLCLQFWTIETILFVEIIIRH